MTSSDGNTLLLTSLLAYICGFSYIYIYTTIIKKIFPCELSLSFLIENFLKCVFFNLSFVKDYSMKKGTVLECRIR